MALTDKMKFIFVRAMSLFLEYEISFILECGEKPFAPP